MNKIAAVGNGGILLETELGKIIDRHKTVARFNNYKIEEAYVKNTGVKTDIWVTTFYRDIRKPTLIPKKVVCPFPLNDKRWNKKYYRNISLIKETNPEFIPALYFIELTKHIVNPSCGMAYLFWLYKTNLLKECDLYGFSFFQGKHHYFEDKGGCLHNGAAEIKLYKKMLDGDMT